MQRRHILMGLSTVCLSLCGAGMVWAAPTCNALIPPTEATTSGKRNITAVDLVGLRDIGPLSVADRRAPLLSLSPDATRIAFQVRQADPVTNTYCLGMFVLDLKPGDLPISVDLGGDFMRVKYSVAGFADYTSPGAPDVVQAKWSPDGKWIAFIRSDHDRRQVWRAKADGSGSQPVTDSAYDIEGFAWAGEGATIVTAGRPGLEIMREEIEQEGRSGFLFNDRYVPLVSSRPMVRESIETVYQSVDVETGRNREASPLERALVDRTPAADVPAAALFPVRGKDSDLAWLAVPEGGDLTTPSHLTVRRAGRTVVCPDDTCTRIMDMWWSKDGQAIVFQRLDGMASDQTGLYEWRIGDPRPRRVLVTNDILIGCGLTGAALICGREGATQPRRIVQIDIETGRETVLFDPNPEFSRLRLGPVERDYWKNNVGIVTYGDLVLPPDYKTGQRLPLVVVQYTSRGFLRGGTGDAFPIQVLAAHGFAVLSFQNTPSVGLAKGVKTWEAVNHADRVNWADRRSIQSALRIGVQRLVDRGLVDPARTGITGLSDGSSTVQFELVNGTRFKAAAVGTCCDEAPSVTMLGGPVVDAFFHQMGYPTLMQPDDGFWAADAYRLNAAHMDTPLLMQLPDREYLGALESYTALKELGKPVEMYVYPDEYHIRWQPAHRLASYVRSVDWFEFWLMDKEDSDPSKAEQYRRWRSLRAQQTMGMGVTPAS